MERKKQQQQKNPRGSQVWKARSSQTRRTDVFQMWPAAAGGTLELAGLHTGCFVRPLLLNSPLPLPGHASVSPPLAFEVRTRRRKQGAAIDFSSCIRAGMCRQPSLPLPVQVLHVVDEPCLGAAWPTGSEALYISRTSNISAKPPTRTGVGTLEPSGRDSFVSTCFRLIKMSTELMDRCLIRPVRFSTSATAKHSLCFCKVVSLNVKTIEQPSRSPTEQHSHAFWVGGMSYSLP